MSWKIVLVSKDIYSLNWIYFFDPTCILILALRLGKKEWDGCSIAVANGPHKKSSCKPDMDNFV